MVVAGSDYDNNKTIRWMSPKNVVMTCLLIILETTGGLLGCTIDLFVCGTGACPFVVTRTALSWSGDKEGVTQVPCY